MSEETYTIAPAPQTVLRISQHGNNGNWYWRLEENGSTIAISYAYLTEQAARESALQYVNADVLSRAKVVVTTAAQAAFRRA